MNTNAPMPLLTAAARFAIAAAVGTLLTVTWVSAESASHEAVATSTASINTRFVKLPDVEIVVRRAAKSPTA